MVLTGAQILMECLKREGVDLIFGFPGGAVIDIYDELPKHPIRHILVRHEQAASVMNRPRSTPPTDSPGHRARWACASLPPVPVRPTP